MEAFSVAAVRAATRNFDEAAVIGRGSFSVFLAELAIGGVPTLVAVKKLNDASMARELGAALNQTALVRNERLLSVLGLVSELGLPAAVARALQEVNAVLEELDFRGSPIGDSGAAVFAGMLRVNTTLKVLKLWGCGVTDTGACRGASSEHWACKIRPRQKRHPRYRRSGTHRGVASEWHSAGASC